jgi:hypothetical protein
MKITLFFTLLILAIVSCTKTNTNSNNNTSSNNTNTNSNSTDTCNCATWDLTKVLDVKWYYNPTGTSNGDSCFVEFKSDGTFNWRSSTIVALDDKKLKYHSGTWKFSKNKVNNQNKPITCRIEVHFSDVLFNDANWYFQVTTVYDSPFRLFMTESNSQADYLYHP